MPYTLNNARSINIKSYIIDIFAIQTVAKKLFVIYKGKTPTNRIVTSNFESFFDAEFDAIWIEASKNATGNFKNHLITAIRNHILTLTGVVGPVNVKDYTVKYDKKELTVHYSDANKARVVIDIFNPDYTDILSATSLAGGINFETAFKRAIYGAIKSKVKLGPGIIT